jgi:hypothetical protein
MNESYWRRFADRRLTRRRALTTSGGAAAAALFLAACGGGSDAPREKASGLLATPVDTTKEAKRGGVWLGSHNADIQTFDPHFQSVPNQALTTIAYSRLFRPKPGIMEPGIRRIAC